MHPLIPSRWQIPAIFHQRLGDQVGRQRLMSAEGHLLLILHKPPKPEDVDRHARLFWRNPAGDWLTTESGAALGELHEHLAEYDRICDRLDALLRGTPSAQNYYQILQEVTPLLRAARFMVPVFQQAREAQPNDRHLLLARDESIEIERNLELLHSEAFHGLQFLIAQRGEEQARQGEKLVASSHRLNLLMALCLPATALASIFGMNLHNGFETEGARIFWTILIAAIFLGFIVLALVAAPVKPKPVVPPPTTKRRK
jgi:hypothetical protein